MLNASFCHAPQALYHLQRGPMLGEVAGHPDERAALATVFLNASSPLAGRMLSPALYVFDAATGTFAAVEPVDIAVIGGARSGSTCFTNSASPVFAFVQKLQAGALF